MIDRLVEARTLNYPVEEILRGVSVQSLGGGADQSAERLFSPTSRPNTVVIVVEVDHAELGPASFSRRSL